MLPVMERQIPAVPGCQTESSQARPARVHGKPHESGILAAADAVLPYSQFSQDQFLKVLVSKWTGLYFEMSHSTA